MVLRAKRKEYVIAPPPASNNRTHKVSRARFSVYQGIKRFANFLFKLLACDCFSKKPKHQVSSRKIRTKIEKADLSRQSLAQPRGRPTIEEKKVKPEGIKSAAKEISIKQQEEDVNGQKPLVEENGAQDNKAPPKVPQEEDVNGQKPLVEENGAQDNKAPPKVLQEEDVNGQKPLVEENGAQDNKAPSIALQEEGENGQSKMQLADDPKVKNGGAKATFLNRAESVKNFIKKTIAPNKKTNSDKNTTPLAPTEISRENLAKFLEAFDILLTKFKCTDKGQFRMSVAAEKVKKLQVAFQKKQFDQLKKIIETEEDQLAMACYIKAICAHIVTSQEYSSNPKDLNSLIIDDLPVSLISGIRDDVAPFAEKLNTIVENFLKEYPQLDYDSFAKATSGTISSLLRGYGYLKDKESFSLNFAFASQKK